ncbi:MAG: glycosyltransferase [Candidatus Falkowbacteria bacterium]
MKLSIIIPVYNEQKTILEILDRVEKAELPAGLEKEIIIVDDNSCDGTRDLLNNLSDRYKVIYNDKNKGKGVCVKKRF